jgi:hypothetical protein
MVPQVQANLIILAWGVEGGQIKWTWRLARPLKGYGLD